MLQLVWTLPCIVALRFWPGTMENAWGTYAVVTVLLSYPYCHAIVVGWASKNSNNVGTRTVSAALYNSEFPSPLTFLLPSPRRNTYMTSILIETQKVCVQLGNIIGNNVYRADDKPKYRRGNAILLALNLLGILLFIATKVYYVLRNRYRERVWNSMTEEVRFFLHFSFLVVELLLMVV